MRVFVTGASGVVGSAVVRELLGAGHQVIGLARSGRAAAAVEAAGAEVFRGSLEDTGGLAAAAAAADGVIHTGYIHDFSPAGNPAGAAALGSACSGKPLVVASGLPAAEPGQVITEDVAAPENAHWPRVSERAAVPLAGRGVRVSVVRLPPSVHGEGDYAFVPALIGIARAQGLSAYVGEGRNVWSAVHRLDAARLFRIALDEAPAGTLLNAFGDEGVPFRDIAETIGRHLDVPVKSVTAAESAAHFGTFALFAAFGAPASSARAQQRLG